MKTIKFVMLLSVSAFLLVACLASPDNPGLPPDPADQDPWQTYTSAKYQFTVRFPSAWQVMELPTADYPTATDQVWFVSETLPLPQTGSRADIVLIFTQEDPSPSWQSQYFDDYQSDTLWLGDVQGKRVSGINKESLSSEIVVLAKIGGYYLQALPNQGEASLEYFDRVVSSLRFVQAEAQSPPRSATLVPESLDELAIVFDGTSLTCPAWLAEGVAAQRIPAFVDPSGFMYDDVPEHMRFDFDDPYTVREPFAGFRALWAPWSRHQSPDRPELQPLLFVFPTGEYAEISPLAGERIQALRALLDSGAVWAGEELPVLPTFNSAQDFRGQVVPLAFQGGRGLRFIARYSQEAMPVVNPAVFYTFQGLTEDGSLYVAAFFPLYTSLLPDQVQVEDWDAFGRGYQNYLAEITSELQGLGPDDFEPNLEALDAVIRSMVIPGTEGSDADGGFDCAAVNQIPAVECEALIALYHSTDGPNWADNSGWLASDTPCTWSGIDCTGGHVSHIHLLYNKLTGTLPPELGDLSHLRVLSLWVNQLYGPIPAELGNLSELVSLDLSDNQLTGPLPAELGELTNLHTLSLAFNQLSGSLPPALGYLRRLESLNLSHNQLSGAIPAELGDQANLYQLDLSHNQLSGPIPAALGGLSKLDELNLSYNQLRGAVPKAITQVSQRTLWGNQLEGTVAGRGKAPIAVDYQGVHFTANPSLATSIWPEVIPATYPVEGGPMWYAAPEHLRFTFANPHLSPGRLRMGINLAAEAQILIYPLAELVGLSPAVQEQIETVQSLLAEQEPVPAGDLPLLPPANAVQVFHAQARYLDFGNIRGLRFITQHTQEDRPVVNNQSLFYTFQGFTDDSAWYVAAFFPVTAAVLPDQAEAETWGAFDTDFASYLSATTDILDHLLPADFTPDLTLLDAVVTSLRLEPNGVLRGQVPPLPLVAPAMGLVYRSSDGLWRIGSSGEWRIH